MTSFGCWIGSLPNIQQRQRYLSFGSKTMLKRWILMMLNLYPDTFSKKGIHLNSAWLPNIQQRQRYLMFGSIVRCPAINLDILLVKHHKLLANVKQRQRNLNIGNTIKHYGTSPADPEVLLVYITKKRFSVELQGNVLFYQLSSRCQLATLWQNLPGTHQSNTMSYFSRLIRKLYIILNINHSFV